MPDVQLFQGRERAGGILSGGTLFGHEGLYQGHAEQRGVEDCRHEDEAVHGMYAALRRDNDEGEEGNLV
eukprot:8958502-Heterocapsa_arctica.AAC.1